jgi:hypothetical protein
VLQQPKIARHLRRRLGDPAQGVQHRAVHFPGVGLASHWERFPEPQLGRHPAIELSDFIVVAGKQLEEGGLSPGGALAATKPERFRPVDHLLHIQAEILHPERGSLAHCSELGRLKVGVCQTGQGRKPRREPLQRREHCDQPAEQKPQSIAHQHQIGIVGHKRAGGSEVEVRAGGGYLIAEGMDVGHHIVAKAPFVPRCRSQVGVIEVLPHLADRRLRNLQSQLALGFGQGEPESAPEGNSAGLSPQRLHCRRRVSGAQRRAPAILGHRKTRSVKVTSP